MTEPEATAPVDLAVTVVVPTYNRPRAVQGLLGALADQDPPPGGFEVVLVDDGGEQPLERVVADFEDRLTMRLVRQANAGPASARNHGASLAKAPLLAFTDDDCRPHPGWVKAFAAAAATSPGCLLAGRTENALADQATTTASETIVAHLADWSLDDEHGVPPFAATNNLAVPADVFGDLGGFDTSFPLAAGEDREFVARAAAHGHPIEVLPAAVTSHAHELDLVGFVRQHHNYGRGGAHYVEKQHEHGEDPGLFKGVGFYAGLLRRALDEGGVPVLLLVLLAQVATALGYVREVVASRT